MKKKVSPSPMPSWRDEASARLRPLVPVVRGMLPIGAAAISAAALVQAVRPAHATETNACNLHGSDESVFEQGVESARVAVASLLFGIAPGPPVQVAGAMAQMEPSTPYSRVTSVASGTDEPTNPIQPAPVQPRPAGGIGSMAPPAPTTKAVTPTPHPPRLGGKPVAPHPTAPRPPGK